jgi:hypothetical protein
MISKKIQLRLTPLLGKRKKPLDGGLVVVLYEYQASKWLAAVKSLHVSA